jgi:hypothetical protein
LAIGMEGPMTGSVPLGFVANSKVLTTKIGIYQCPSDGQNVIDLPTVLAQLGLSLPPFQATRAATRFTGATPTSARGATTAASPPRSTCRRRSG